MADQPRLLMVAHGLPPARLGGAELVTWRIARILARAGVPVAVFHPETAGSIGLGELVRGETRGVVRYTLGTEAGAETSRHARRAFSRTLGLWQPDAVWIHHLSGLSLDVPEIAIAEGLRVALTFHDYTWMCPRGQLVDGSGDRCEGPAAERCPDCLAPGAPWPARWAAGAVSRRLWLARQRRARTVVEEVNLRTSPSAHVARRHEAWLGRRRGVEVLGNPAPRVGRLPLPPSTGPLAVGYFGSLLPTKGVEVLLKAQASLPEGRIQVQLHGPLPPGDRWRDWRHRVRSLAARTGAQLAGPYAPSELSERLAEVEVVCLPSTWEENAPVVLQEARAAGRLVVASEIGGIPELAPAPPAVLVPSGDVEALASALGGVESLRDAGRSLWAEASPDGPPDEAFSEFVERLGRR
jgi:glycosyltransferase involved in cell wall biosynthesis